MVHYSFKDKAVLVTGASGGLGSALVKILADRGARLIVTSRSEKAIQELIQRLPETTQVKYFTADLSVKGEAEKLARNAISAFGVVDCLFNNAGLGYFALMEETSDENIRYLFEINTFSPLALIRILVPHMKQRRSGRIVNIVSAAGRVPIPSVGVYGGSKSALAVMANTMRLELEPFGIDIINVYPGTIDSSFEENALREKNRSGFCPTERCGEPKLRIAQQVVTAAEGKAGEVWLEREGKRLAVGSLIWPKLVDRRIRRLRDKVVKNEPMKQRRWRLLQVESAIACNLKCVMCPWKEVRDKAANRGIMDQKVWDAVKQHLPEVASLDLTGGGEPLLQPNLTEWVADGKAAGCETGFLTNGLLLTEKITLNLLASGLDWICVSMDGASKETYERIRIGSDFDRVCENVARIARMRSGPAPKIMINFVLMRMNFHEAEDMIRLAARLGADQVNFKQCEVIRGEHGKGYGLFASEETKEIRRLSKLLSRARKLGRTLNIETTAFPFVPTELPVCAQDPRDSVFVRFDGSVAPCINLAIGGPTSFFGTEVIMPTIHYGRLPQQDLLELFETVTCKFYKQRFQERVQAYEKTYMDALTGGSHSGLDKLRDKASKAMPEAPQGCLVCHYLYDI
ncbi:MAG: SDR family NAD(P)-dependent oxidoreductase [Desulfomonile tiedjei]|uniref:SDR family NAD(P)-dependent oxidoreductase n=1 Tax=Desulfomonile tiedjei TaxID=2358 RepID=A0A9D6Z1R2_9BACT|nr:SDR family NAD(P)-dependent oxidoreductase [Desulfomonile tiedjei]